MATPTLPSGPLRAEPVVNPFTGFTVSRAPLAQAGIGGATVAGYQLGPISAGIDSPLGMLFGWMNGISNSYNAGLHLVINDPGDAGAVLASDQYTTFTPDQAARIAKSQERDLSANPFRAGGNIAGAILGTGTAAAGLTIGSAGATAAPGVSSGAQAGAQGVTTVAAAGASGGFAGTIQGLGAGLAATLSANAGDPSLIFVAVVVLVIILAAK